MTALMLFISNYRDEKEREIKSFDEVRLNKSKTFHVSSRDENDERTLQLIFTSSTHFQYAVIF